jgi:hypothetical protein
VRAVGTLRVIACIKDPPLIAKILGHVRRPEILTGSDPPAPPDSQQVIVTGFF